MSDTADRDIMLVEQQHADESASISFSDSFDIFDVDYDALHKQAIKDAWKEMKELEESESEDGKVTTTTAVNGTDTALKNSEELDDIQIAECVISNTSVNDCSLVDLNNDDCILLDDSDILKSSNKSNRRSKRKSAASKRGNGGQGRSKKTKGNTRKNKNMKMELEELSKQISENNAAYDQHNQSEVTVLSDDEDEEVNREIRLRIKWGSSILRVPIRQLQPFSEVYRVLGEQHKVSPTRILLSHNDRLIPPDLCPRDLAITLADFIEGGILTEEDVSGGSRCDRVEEVSQQPNTQDPDSILLKVQNSDRKGSVTLHLHKYDKMKILMLRYAELQKAKLKNLKFIFDGEILDPNATPDSLDLDGGECIDVHWC